MEKIAKLFINQDERENVFEIFENFYQNFNFEFGTEHDNLYIAGIATRLELDFVLENLLLLHGTWIGIFRFHVRRGSSASTSGCLLPYSSYLSF